MSQKSLIMISFSVILVLFLVTFFLTQSSENNNAIQDYQSGEVTNVESLEDEEDVDLSNKPQAKIDVKVACESALMYTTFADGVAADAYVTECIEGKHPDVIDKYIESLDFGEGVAI
jgi:hypothetical protein